MLDIGVWRKGENIANCKLQIANSHLHCFRIISGLFSDCFGMAKKTLCSVSAISGLGSGVRADLQRRKSGLTAKEEVEAERRGKREGTTGEGPAAKLRGTVAPALKEPGGRGRRRQRAQEAGDVKECLSRENS